MFGICLNNNTLRPRQILPLPKLNEVLQKNRARGDIKVMSFKTTVNMRPI